MLFTIRSGTAHRFAKDPLKSFEEATTNIRSASTPSMLLGTFMHALLFGSNNTSFIMSDNVTAKVKLISSIDNKDTYGVKPTEYNLYTKYINAFKKSLKNIPLGEEILSEGIKEKTLYVSKEDYFNTMGLELNFKDVSIHGTPDIFYIKDDVLYLVDFKTTNIINEKTWLFYMKSYGYLSQFLHYQTLIKLSGYEFKETKFIHWIQSTSSMNKSFLELGANLMSEGREQFINDNKFMCSMLNKYGENFIEDYLFELKAFDISNNNYIKEEVEEVSEAINEDNEYNLMGTM